MILELGTHIIYAIQANSVQISDCKRPSLTVAAAPAPAPAPAPDVDELGAAAGGALCDTSLMTAELLWLLSAWFPDALVGSAFEFMLVTFGRIVTAEPLMTSVMVDWEFAITYTSSDACPETVYISDPTRIAV